MHRSLSLLFVLAGAAAVYAQHGEAHESGENLPYMPSVGLEALPYAFPGPEDVINRQVNISPTGMDILNDAANEPSIWLDLLNPNEIVIAWRQFDNINSDFRQAGVAYSHDGGLTWTNVSPLDPGVFRSDPVLTGDLQGNFYLNSLNYDASNQIVTTLFRSSSGASWTTVGESRGGDKAWIARDNTGGVGDGNLYNNWNWTATAYGSNDFSRSLDDGLSWSTPVSMPNHPKWGTSDLDRDGTYWVAGANGGTAYYVLRSSNLREGVATPTWDIQRTMAFGGRVNYFFLSNAANPAGLHGQVYVVVDKTLGPTKNHVYYLDSNYRNTTNPCDLYMMRSTDNGATWGSSTRFNNDPANQSKWHWHGTIAVAPSGRVDVIWYDTRESTAINQCRMYQSSSWDGGTTWSPQVPITPQFNSHAGWPVQQKLGDYISMISHNDKAHIAYAATFTGGQDVYYMALPIQHPVISGSVTLGDWGGPVVGEAVTYEVLYQGNLISEGSWVLGAGGSFSMTMSEFVAGTYQVRVKGRTWLSELNTVTFGASVTPGLTFTLPRNGDVDGDNEVGPGDFSLLANAFLSVNCDPNWNRNADLDGDAEVGPGDFAILASNFLEAGD